MVIVVSTRLCQDCGCSYTSTASSSSLSSLSPLDFPRSSGARTSSTARPPPVQIHGPIRGPTSSLWTLVLVLLLMLSVILLVLLTLGIFSLLLSSNSPKGGRAVERRLENEAPATKTEAAHSDGLG